MPIIPGNTLRDTPERSVLSSVQVSLNPDKMKTKINHPSLYLSMHPRAIPSPASRLCCRPICPAYWIVPLTFKMNTQNTTRHLFCCCLSCSAPKSVECERYYTSYQERNYSVSLCPCLTSLLSHPTSKYFSFWLLNIFPSTMAPWLPCQRPAHRFSLGPRELTLTWALHFCLVTVESR
jgi:hypothetical protein